jgi:hypothetical protein
MDRLKVGIIFGGCSEEHPISVKSAQEVAKTSTPRSTSRSTSGSRRAVPGSSVTAPTRIGRTAVAVRPCCHRTGACTDCSSWSRGSTKRSAWTSCCPFCTASSARTVRCRACWSSPASPTWAATSRVPLCAWTSPSPTSSRGARDRHAEFWTVTANEKIDPDRLTYPVFVKPARSGSSFGVSKVSGKEELPSAVETAKAVRLEGADRGGRRRQRGRLCHPGERSGSDRRRGGPGRAVSRLLQNPPGGASRKAAPRTRRSSFPPTFRPSRARSSRRRQRPSTAPWDAGAGAGGHVPQGGRNGRPQRGQHAARPDLVQPLSENDGGRGACRSPK